MSPNSRKHAAKYVARRPLILASVVVLATTVAVSTAVYRMIVVDPNVVLLRTEGDAHWIRVDRPFELRSQISGDVVTEFRRTFELDAPASDLTLTVRALKRATVFLDGRLIVARMSDADEWKQPLQATVANVPEPGRHELRIAVVHADGPAAVMVRSNAAELNTSFGWEARIGTDAWREARPVDDPRPIALSREFPTTGQAIARWMPLWLLLFSAVFLGTWATQAEHSFVAPVRKFIPSAGAVRWLLIAGWAVLAMNNVLKVPLPIGFDVRGHLAYVGHLLEHQSLPLASDGWQMFQAPLYYVVTALLHPVLWGMFAEETAWKLLRSVSLLCGMAQVEICYRGLKHVFPGRNDLQIAGVLLGGLLPMNLYLSQGFGNEPMAAMFASITIVLAFSGLRDPATARSARWQCLIGLSLGLAILSKVTHILLIPPVLALLVYQLRAAGCRREVVASGGARVVAVVAAVAGWFFVRNWFRLGTPLILSSTTRDRQAGDPANGLDWWQDPGYRTLDDFTSFGEVLVQPIYATHGGFWDTVYSTFWLDGFLSSMVTFASRPPWNYSFVIGGSLWALLPTAAMVLGGATLFRQRDMAARTALGFAVACIALYFAALLCVYVHLPIYSAGKATYTLGLLPCYAVLGAAGIDFLGRYRALKALVFALLACWALSSYLAYFVI